MPPIAEEAFGQRSSVGDTQQSVSEHSNTEGTRNQAALGPKPQRKHFFSPLDPAYADAVHRDAETVEYSPDEERAVRKKIDNTVLPLVICSYIFNQFGGFVYTAML
ncbi:hypothetical protein CVT24_012969 [Panaeolus cyanescens]|uniref:Uncharacterized protein n=1 Tax=Panaeolus cyanescens TaxID=181874 RepID=A0A409WA65_9AGAR|nr:hypothetical protein CVT24_012969 [Panaeolus cyanescens]